MAYKYIPASLNAGAQKDSSPKNDYIELFQATLDEQFYNASNWWTIEEETTIGSAEYEDVDVRIAHVINAETGLKLGDDWKTLLFKTVSHPVELGKQYSFEDSIWLTVNTEIVKNLTATCTIRRCNNTMRWLDENTGAYYEEPCAIEYLVKEPRNYATQGSPFITPGGFLHIEMQLNERSGKIRQNQRFLFGSPNHWTCYRIIGTGVNDFRNTKTYDHTSAKILSLDLIADFISPELDDMARGIADVYTNLYTLELNHDSIIGETGKTYQLSYEIVYNGTTSDREVVWSSSNPLIASVDGNGLVTFNAVGTAEISAQIRDNPAFDTCTVTVGADPMNVKEIILTPNQNYVLESTYQDFSIYLYENGIQSLETFTVTCNPNSVPSENYIFQQLTDNSFRIGNRKRSDTSYLTINCEPSSGSAVSYDIRLVGAWNHGYK